MPKQILSWMFDHHLTGVGILGTSLVLALTIYATRPQAAPRASIEKAWPVSIIKSNPLELAPILTAYGKVESRQVANLKTSIIAPVAEVLTHEGQWVNQGDLLLQLDATELELALGIARSNYDQQLALLESVRNDFDLAEQLTPHFQELKGITDAKLKRHLNLYSNQMMSDAIVDEVRRQASQQAIILAEHFSGLKDFPNKIKRQEALVSENKANLDKAYLDLAQTRITSPFDGRVIKTFVASGDRILPGVPLIQVADHNGLEVRTSIPTQVGRALRQQMAQGASIKATGIIDAQRVQFTLSRLSADIKLGQSGLDAFFSPDNQDSLDIGRVIAMSVTLPTQSDVVVLPIQSIYDNNRIYRVEDNRLVGMEIEQVGDYIDSDGQYRILVRSAQISKGDVLVTTQLPRAITGLLVEPIDASTFDHALAVKHADDEKKVVQ